MIFLLAVLLGFAFIVLALMPGGVNHPGLMVGMSQYRVTLAWGAPSQVNRTATPTGPREEWVYVDPPRRAYFSNGFLYAWRTY